MIFNNKKKLFFSLALIFLVGIFLIPVIVLAQDISLGIEYGSALQLGTRDVRDIVVAIINVLLGFLGVVAVVIILYGGYVWMTAGGSPDKVAFAKKIIINGVIGLVIILSAFAIANFVIKMLGEAVIPGVVCQENQTEPCSNIGVCERERLCTNNQWGSCYFVDPRCDPFPPESFYLTDTTPSDGDELPIRNVMVSLYLSHQVAEENFDTAVTIEQTETGDPVDLIVEKSASNPKKVEIRPATPCPDPYSYEYCFDYYPPDYNLLNWYTVTVIPDEQTLSFLSALNGEPVTCQLGVPCTFEFRVGPLIDTMDPDAELTKADGTVTGTYEPWNTNLNISFEDDYIFWALGNDESAVASIEFFEPVNNSIGVDTPLTIVQTYEGQSGIPSPPYGTWDPELLGYSEGDIIDVRSVVTDYAGHMAESIKQVKLWPSHCYNNSCDPGESCYTNPALPINCGVECPPCEGEWCSSEPEPTCVPDDSLCVSNICIPVECTCFPMPVIENFDPIDGAPGIFVTISGQHFGDDQGWVRFVDLGGNETLARFPSEVVAECDDTWTNTQVIVELPLTLIQGDYYYIKLATNDPTYGSFIDTTINNNGPVLDDFLVNDVERPGLCEVSPNVGVVETFFDLYGVNFESLGVSQRSIEFGMPPQSVPASNQNFLNDNHAQGNVPNINPGQVPIVVVIDTLESNSLAFTVESVGYAGDPYITNFTPITGPIGQYVTIYGGNFGTYIAGQSSVEFNGIPVDFGDFPVECGTDFWHDDFIVVKVPDDPAMATGPIMVIREDGARATSSDNFEYDPTAPLIPGICSMYPQEGYEGDPVEIVGEYFEDSSVNFTTIVLPDPPDLGAPGHADVFEINVPDNSVTGEVIVQDNINPTIASGPWPFIVTVGEPTFAGNFGYYQWQFETCANCYVPQVLENPNCFNELASPTPPNSGAGNTAANIDSVLGVRFNVDMDNSGFVYNTVGQSNPTYIIQQCNGNATIENLPFDGGACQDFVWTGQETGYPEYDDNSPEYVMVKPGNDFSSGYWYRVILTNGLISESEGYPLGENLNFMYYLGFHNDSFEWHFRTRLTAEACEPDTAMLEPASRIEDPNPIINNPIELGQTVNYSASAQDSATCAICPNNFIWGWDSDHPGDALIDLTTQASTNQLYANGLIRQPDVGIITVESSEYLNGDPLPMTISGTAELNIVPPKPYLEIDNDCILGGGGSLTAWPSPTPYMYQQYVCSNAKISARFVDSQGNPIEMYPTSFSTITVQDNTFPIPNTISGTIIETYTGTVLNGFIFTPNSFFPDAEYRVSLAGVRSAEGDFLEGINSWYFTTINEVCDFTLVLVSPSPNTINLSINPTSPYNAGGFGEDCILLQDPPGTTWDWNSEDLIIADVTWVNPGQTSVAEVTGFNLGYTYIRATAQPLNLTNTGENGRVTVTEGPPEFPLTITDHQPQSPPPVCLNALIRIDFSEPIQVGVNDPPSYNDSVIKCLNPNCTSQEIVLGNWTISGNGSRYDFTPNQYLDSNSEYLVWIQAGANGVIAVAGNNNYLTAPSCFSSGLTMINVNQCAWFFDTGEELCAVENIFINVLDVPTTTQATVYEGETTGWQATAYAENGNPLTNVMDDWTAEEPDVANLTPYTTPPYNNDRYRYSIGAIDRTLYGTTTMSTDIWATIDEVISLGEIIQEHVTSTPGHLTVLPVLAGPSVIDTKPMDESEDVCLNALVSVKFDKHLDEETVSSETFKIRYNTSVPQGDPDGILTFDGQGDFLSIATAAAEGLNMGEEEFMIEAWVKLDTPQFVYGNLVVKNGSGGFYYLRQYQSDGKIRFRLNDMGGLIEIQTNTGLDDNSWHHLVALLDRSSSTGIRMYVDGQLQNDTADPTSLTSISNDGDFYLGGQTNSYINGSIASLRIYKFGALNVPVDIEDLIQYQSENPLLISGDLSSYLVGDWEMEDENNIGLDSSAYGHDLTTYGAPVWSQTAEHTTYCEEIIVYQPPKKKMFFDTILARFMNSFVGQLFSSLYSSVFQKAQAYQTYTGYWCSISDYGEWSMENSILYSTVKFNLNQFLPENVPIQVKVIGGEDGIMSIEGWPLEDPNDGDDFVYTFETGDTYCELSFVTVTTEPEGLSNEWLFLTPEDDQTDNVTDPEDPNFDAIYDSDKVYFAHGFTVDGQELERVPGIPPYGYSWTWSWTSLDPAIASILYPDNENSYSIVGAENNSGETEVTVSAEPYQAESLTADGLAIVDLCQNPWPERDLGSIEVPKYIDEDYNFALRYCRDAGGSGVTDDLPALAEEDFVIVENIPTDLEVDELLKEYLIPVPTTGDLIGIQIYENSFHLTPMEWYQENIEVQGSPITQTVDGYPAIQDGRTTYVGAANVVLDMGGRATLGPSQTKLVKKKSWLAKAFDYLKENLLHPFSITYGQGGSGYKTPNLIDSDKLYTNIYLLSYNQGAAPETMEIVNQFLENWLFNINIEEGELKPKIVNDLSRLNGLSTIASALDNYQENHSGSYPLLMAGTFVPGMSTSKWPSWSQTLGSELGAGMPVDPLNSFNECIDCEEPDLINDGFEATTTPILGWSLTENASVEINTDPQFVHQGSQSVIVAAYYSSKGIVSDSVSLIPNTTYELSAWVYVEAPNRAQLTFSCNAPGGCGDDYGNQWFTPPDYTGWFQLTNRLITPSESLVPNPTAYIYLFSFANQAVFYADEVVLQTAGGNCGYDPETCWNPEGNSGQGAFACDEGSYIYSYQNVLITDYELSAKMEASINWWPENTATIEYIDSHIDLSMDNVAVCTSQVLAGVCGDNFVFPPEQCEPGMSSSFCTPGFSWYTPQSVGCNPAGSTAPQPECQWYDPLQDPSCVGMNMTKCCGGYCGDAVLNSSPTYNVSPAEECDYNAPVGASGFANGQPQYSSATNQYFCSSNCEESGGWCGDSELNSPWEGCDNSAPSGSQGFGGGTASYDQYSCGTLGPTTCQDTGGWCGDATVQGTYGESCDKGATTGASWAHGDPSLATGLTMQYECSYNCLDSGGYCGNSNIESQYEECDNTLGLTGWDCTEGNTVSCPAAPDSNACQRYCSAGCLYQGECGNDVIEGTSECGEICDGTDKPPNTDCNINCNSYSCDGDWLDCNGLAGDGCEVNPNTNIFNCGDCYPTGDVCNYMGGGGQPVCNMGSCEIQCDSGFVCPYSSWQTSCDSIDHCGDCGTVCPGPTDPAYGYPTCNSSTCDIYYYCSGTVNEPWVQSGIVITPTFSGSATTTVVLHAGESTSIELSDCRISGAIYLDMVVDAGVMTETTGIVFVSDRSGSMGGWEILALIEALAYTGNAIDTIFAVNPAAEVALVSYNSSAWTDLGFTDITGINTLKATVNAYTASGGTNHIDGLNQALSLFQTTPYDNQIVIFMTDGGSASAAAISTAATLKGSPNNIDLFSVALTSNNSLIAFMNGISSSECACEGANCDQSSSQSCDGGTVNCASTGPGPAYTTYYYFEECDGGTECGSDCQWLDDNDKRAYHTTDPATLTYMYTAIAGAIPVENVGLTFGGELQGTLSPGPGGVITDYLIDATGLTCIQGQGNSIPISIEFTGGPDATITLENPRYNICPW